MVSSRAELPRTGNGEALTAINSWLAGAFDVNGRVYGETGGLGIRIYFPKRSLANQVRLAIGGGKVAGMRPSHITITLDTDLERFVNQVGPFVRGQREALEILQEWREHNLGTFEAGTRLSDFYDGYRGTE